MKIELYTDKAQSLIDKIYKAIEDETLKTWIIKKGKDDIKYLTHIPDQYENKAIFRLQSEKDKLVVFLMWWIDQEPTESIKGIYMGRITEMFLVHFPTMFTKFEIIK